MMTAAPATSIEHAIGASGTCVLVVRSGDTRIQGVAGDVARVRSANGGPLDDFDIETVDGRLTIRARRRGDRTFGRDAWRTVDLIVDVPTAATVVVEGASGDIFGEGLTGDQRYRSASGDIELRGSGGTIDAEGMSGDVDITAVAPIDLTVRTVSGDLAVRAGTIERLRATSTSGDVRIAGRLEAPGPFSLETVSGDVILAPASDIRLEATTLTGDIRSDVPARAEGGPGHRVLVTGAGGPTVTFRSMSGDLRVVRATTVDMRVVSPPPPVVPATDPADDARLEILHALERGEIDVIEAGRRLESLDA